VRRERLRLSVCGAGAGPNLRGHPDLFGNAPPVAQIGAIYEGTSNIQLTTIAKILREEYKA